MSAVDREREAIAAYLAGADDACEQAWDAAHRAAIEEGDPATAARCAVWLGLCLMLRGQMAQAGGWLGRAEALLAGAGECAASGYLLVPQALGALEGGHPEAARDLAAQAAEIGTRTGDADLRAFGVLGHGQALVAMGDLTGGTARLDDVMLSVTAGEVGPITSGIVYCAVILECMAIFDLRRAAEWTRALGEWCDSHPDLVPFRGQCLVHRAQLHQVEGRWADAIATAEAARRHLTEPPHPGLGLAHYQEGELQRLVGALDDAEACYRLASRHGHDPMPGLALLELARGNTAGAAAAITRSLGEAHVATERPALLAAAVDIYRAAGDVGRARGAADELAAIAASSPSPVLHAMASQATGAVLVAEGDVPAGLVALRAAARGWQTLRMPYEAARTAVLVGMACAALGDHAAAALELDNAGATFAELGARPDLERLTALTGERAPGDSTGLSAREREVLAELAAGKTNREIADALVISQHTVGRHVEHIFTKLGVTTRAAATAIAYERGLLAR